MTAAGGSRRDAELHAALAGGRRRIVGPGVAQASLGDALALDEALAHGAQAAGEQLARRLAAGRDGLVKGEGIPETRLRDTGPSDPPPGAGEGRVEFRIAQ